VSKKLGPYHHDYVRYRKKSPLNTREGALLYEATLRRRLAAGEPLVMPATTPPPAPATFAEFAREWFETYVTANNKPSERENKEYVLHAHLLPAFGAVAVGAIGSREVERFKSMKSAAGLSNKTVNNLLAVLSKALACAQEWGVIERAPRLKLLRVTPPAVEVLSDDECERLQTDRAEPMWNLMVLVALRTGLRLGELLGLQWVDVDLSAPCLTVQHSLVRGVLGTPKNHKIRTVPLAPDVVRAMSSRTARRRFLFDQDGGEPTTPARASGALARMCQRAGTRRITWHILRHTFATQLCQGRVPIRDVQALLGHSSLLMTQRYTHVRQEHLAAAVNYLCERPRTAQDGQPVGNTQRESTGAPPPAPRKNEKYADISTHSTW
jgi:integrase